MADKFTFGSAGEIQEVEFAFARNGWTHPLVKKATQGALFGLFREVVEGRAEICRIQRLTEATPRHIELAPRWREENGVIYFSVTSDGTTGSVWISRLKQRGFQLNGYAESMICSSDFVPTPAGTIHKVAVLKGRLFSDSGRVTRKIRAAADAGTLTPGHKLFAPHPEVACLIRENFSDKDIEKMGLRWIITMHDPIYDPIKDLGGDPSLLGTGRGVGGGWLDAGFGGPGFGWGRGNGFAFVLSQVSPLP